MKALLKSNPFRRLRSDRFEDFLGVVREYESFATEYFSLFGCPSATWPLVQTQTVLARLWVRRRELVSRVRFDQAFFEELQRPLDERVLACRPPIPALRQLNLDDRFLLVGIELEGWGFERMSAVFSARQPALARRALRIRCDLIGLHFIDLNTRQQRLLEEVSARLLESRADRKGRDLSRETATCRSIRDFKSRWLEFRSLLIEWRQDVRPGEDERRFLEEGCRELVLRIDNRKKLFTGTVPPPTAPVAAGETVS